VGVAPPKNVLAIQETLWTDMGLSIAELPFIADLPENRLFQFS
jgi:hypothetical protein